MDNKRIAKNTLVLYFRMFLTMVVGLYTSRVVLATLGVEDYGIYGIVGGVVGMMGFLNSAMAGATSRFLTYELGRGDEERLQKTFSSAMIVHIIISLIVFFVAETIGLWYVINKLVIPEGRLVAALVVYQFSILSSILGITQVPYNSNIIAHEKMDVYAYVEILNVILKLLIVYLLVIGDFDKLVLYSILYFISTFVVMMVYRIYCLRKFSECKFHWVWDKEYLKPLLSFSGWNLFGNLGSVVGNQGINLVINSFFGVVMNAASSIAITVSGIVNLFASNAMTAFRPPITKKYAQGDVLGMQSLTLMAIKIVMSLYALVAIPVFIECDYLLSLWLVEVPYMTLTFCKVILIGIFFETIRYVIIIDIHASGKVKRVSALSGIFFCLSPIIVYLIYIMGASVEYAFVVIAAVNVLLSIANIFIVKRCIPGIEIIKYFWAFAKVLVSAFASLVATYYFASVFEQSFFRLMGTGIFSTVFQILIFISICVTASQRKVIMNFIKTKIHL